ncbi:coproporphyrinogen dehydrogenase HemZ [Clostridium sp. D2Q-14]|uniref:coproporphyrinogen dehydrogenase HemZ n=1 Tax=Anaeromonas gelatinilytica TaxID=2683194 RepID=UPI00193C6D5D|nr:coproporphyrinogen dehydrogenase HemZ [Anaeromonas gelatinilytica]MBS4534229.1 coproporphyrinogen dehydrogenase HemZ [Anaeromonas gelatinilytica]
MIRVYLNGHNDTHNIYELLRILTEIQKIEFVNDEKVCNEDLFIISSLNGISVKTEVFKDGKLIAVNNIKDINKVNIKRDLNKKKSIAIKKSLYKVIEDMMGSTVPWGILTGIRPSKIVHELKEKEIKKDEIFNILTKEYLITEDKSKLLLEITDVEEKYLYPLDKNNYSLYVSIPFCPSKCVYCSFPSYPLGKWRDVVDKYTEALLNELEEIANLMKGKNIQTVYIGGGTPTSIPKENLVRIIKTINSLFGRENIKEFTVEAGRPDTIKEEILQNLKKNYVDRISINPQTMSKKTLELVGREHNPEDIEKAYNIAKKVGFNSINMDVIVGLPGEDVGDIKNTMKKILDLDPDNLTVHTLAIKKTSKLNIEKEKYDLAKTEKIKDMLKITKNFSKKMEMISYYMYRQKQILGNFENIGYAKKNKECIYNILMMEEKQTIIGAGSGAVSKIFYPSKNRLVRVPNVKNLKDYIDRKEEMIERKRVEINKMLTSEE